MSSQSVAREFLSQRRIAVVGISRNEKDFSRSVYKRFLQKGHEVYAVNPNAESTEGMRYYRSVRDLPGPVDGALVMIPPTESAAPGLPGGGNPTRLAALERRPGRLGLAGGGGPGPHRRDGPGGRRLPIHVRGLPPVQDPPAVRPSRPIGVIDHCALESPYACPQRREGIATVTDHRTDAGPVRLSLRNAQQVAPDLFHLLRQDDVPKA